MRRIAGCLSLITAASVAVLAQAPAPAAAERHFLWTVTAPGAPPTYLLGSIHVLTPDYYPLSAPIEKAFASSGVLIEELNLDDMADPAVMMAVASKAMLPNGRTLDKVVPAELSSRVMAAADKAGVPREAVLRMKPWMVSLMLTLPILQSAGFTAAHGVDAHFFERAKKRGLERRALETVAYQIDRLDQMAATDQEALLRSTIDDLEVQVSNVKTVADAWKRGDTSVLEQLLLPTLKQTPNLYQRMLVERNAEWVDDVEGCLKQKQSCFVVVGAAHLVGPDSLVEMLRKKGYRVEQQ